MANFYYQQNGRVFGPITGDQLREASIAGRVRAESWVASNPGGPWVPATKVRGLFSSDEEGPPHSPITQRQIERAKSRSASISPIELEENASTSGASAPPPPPPPLPPPPPVSASVETRSSSKSLPLSRNRSRAHMGGRQRTFIMRLVTLSVVCAMGGLLFLTVLVAEPRFFSRFVASNGQPTEGQTSGNEPRRPMRDSPTESLHLQAGAKPATPDDSTAANETSSEPLDGALEHSVAVAPSPTTDKAKAVKEESSRTAIQHPEFAPNLSVEEQLQELLDWTVRDVRDAVHSNAGSPMLSGIEAINALLKTAELQASLQDDSGAFETIKLIKRVRFSTRDHWFLDGLATIGMVQADRGDVNAATSTSEQLRNQPNRIAVAARLYVHNYRLQNRGQANRTLEQVHRLISEIDQNDDTMSGYGSDRATSDLFRAFLDTKQPDKALKLLAGRKPDLFSYTYVTYLANAGYPEIAEKEINRLLPVRPLIGTYALGRIANAYTVQGQYEDAFRAANMTPVQADFVRLRAYGVLARDLDARGRRSEAILNEIEGIALETKTVGPIVTSAEVLAEAGEVRRVLNVLSHLGRDAYPFEEAKIWLALAAAKANSNDRVYLDNAVHSLGRIDLKEESGIRIASRLVGEVWAKSDDTRSAPLYSTDAQLLLVPIFYKGLSIEHQKSLSINSRLGVLATLLGVDAL